MAADPPHLALPASSFLEKRFLRWVLAPATAPEVVRLTRPQAEVVGHGRMYKVDYEVVGNELLLAIELDGFEFHSSRRQFTYDRFRQNDLHAAGRTVLRFSYDAIRFETARCVAQLQELMRLDPLLVRYVVPSPTVPMPDDMAVDPLFAIAQPARRSMSGSYFDLAREKIDRKTLRDCQVEAFGALANYYAKGGDDAATVMAVGAGKTALGVLACLGFAQRRAMILTPGSVIRGTFDRALDHRQPAKRPLWPPGRRADTGSPAADRPSPRP